MKTLVAAVLVLIGSVLSASPAGAADGNGFEGLMAEYEATAEKEQVSDPLYPYNYAVYTFNDRFYFYVLKPAAKAYKAVVLPDFRICIKNFFHNVLFPVRFVNSALQGKLSAAGREIQIFVINSTVGCVGFGQPAQEGLGLKTTDEDLGQTLGTYAVGEGFYIVWPFLGPSTLRDTVGLVGDVFVTPLTYVESAEAAWGLKVLDTVNAASFRLGDYEAVKKGAVDPYAALKDGYIQNRRKKIEE